MEKQLQTAHLSLGSNLGDRTENLEQAIVALADALLFIRKVSSLFETEPVGHSNQPWFLNMAAAVETLLSPEELLERCLEVERRFGRVRVIPYGPRTVDIDILLYGDRTITKDNLVIPHPRMAERRFVLQPLAEIAPHATHPLLGHTVTALLASCSDKSTVVLHTSGGLR